MYKVQDLKSMLQCCQLFSAINSSVLSTLHCHQLFSAINSSVPSTLQCNQLFSAINSSGPQYLADLLQIYAPSRQLRSSADTCALCIPSVHTQTYIQRPSSHSAPTPWDNLSKAIKNSESALSFKSVLETFLFQLYN